MLVRDALVANPLIVSPSTSLFELVDRILGGNQTTAAVVDQGRLVGIVSSTDVLKKLIPSYLYMDASLAGVLHPTFFEERLDQLRNVRVDDVMERHIVALPPDATVMQAVVLFVQSGHKTVPVVGADGMFHGSVTRRSVLTLVRRSAGN